MNRVWRQLSSLEQRLLFDLTFSHHAIRAYQHHAAGWTGSTIVTPLDPRTSRQSVARAATTTYRGSPRGSTTCPRSPRSVPARLLRKRGTAQAPTAASIVGLPLTSAHTRFVPFLQLCLSIPPPTSTCRYRPLALFCPSPSRSRSPHFPPSLTHSLPLSRAPPSHLRPSLSRQMRFAGRLVRTAVVHHHMLRAERALWCVRHMDRGLYSWRRGARCAQRGRGNGACIGPGDDEGSNGWMCSGARLTILRRVVTHVERTAARQWPLSWLHAL